MSDKKEKQYVYDNAQLMAEWDWGKNSEIGLDPHKLLPGSNKKAWWKCYNGHEWKAVIHTRFNGVRCPYCSNRNI